MCKLKRKYVEMKDTYRYMVEKGRRNSGMNMNGGGGKELRGKVTKSECDGIERKQKILMEKEKDIEWDG